MPRVSASTQSFRSSFDVVTRGLNSCLLFTLPLRLLVVSSFGHPCNGLHVRCRLGHRFYQPCAPCFIIFAYPKCHVESPCKPTSLLLFFRPTPPHAARRTTTLTSRDWVKHPIYLGSRRPPRGAVDFRGLAGRVAVTFASLARPG